MTEYQETYGIHCPSENSLVKGGMGLMVNFSISLLALDVMNGKEAHTKSRWEPLMSEPALSCSACEGPIIEEVFESAYLPFSLFCSLDCRDAAEFAAESVR